MEIIKADLSKLDELSVFSAQFFDEIWSKASLRMRWIKMIELIRKKDYKWIFQKNISSKDLIESYVKVISENKVIDKSNIQQRLRIDNAYRGRSTTGSLSTMGVRFSQMCFYMFGYKANNSTFIPSQTTLNILESEQEMNKNMLVNLFALQFPHPYSKTPQDFKIYAGRLIIKLLTDSRIEKNYM